MLVWEVSMILLTISEQIKTYREGNVIQENVESGRSLGQVLSHKLGNHLSLGNELTGIELGHHALEHLVHNRGQHTLVIVGAEGSVNLRQSLHLWSRQHTAGNVDHLQILGARQGGDVSGLCSHIVDDGGFKPGDVDVSACDDIVSRCVEMSSHVVLPSL